VHAHLLAHQGRRTSEQACPGLASCLGRTLRTEMQGKLSPWTCVQESSARLHESLDGEAQATN
jgi:hypothetical protein